MKDGTQFHIHISKIIHNYILASTVVSVFFFSGGIPHAISRQVFIGAAKYSHAIEGT